MALYKLLLVLSMIYLNDAIECYKCNGRTLDECIKTSSKCKSFHNRCLSLLMEGGKYNKIYYKGCGTSGGCNAPGLQKKCEGKQDIFGTGLVCRPSCCATDNCNNSNRYTVSWVTMIVLLVIAVKNNIA